MAFQQSGQATTRRDSDMGHLVAKMAGIAQAPNEVSSKSSFTMRAVSRSFLKKLG